MTNRDFIEVTNYTASVRDFFRNINRGMSDLKLYKDSGGIATGVVLENEVDFVNKVGAEIRTGFFPDTEEEYSIIEIVKLTTGETEVRILTKSATEIIYTINDVVQPAPPPLKATEVILNDVTVIGIIDPIDVRYDSFEIETRVLTVEEKTLFFENWVIANFSLVDDYGNTLVDDDGAILHTLYERSI